MSLLQLVTLSVIQGLAELLPVSSSAHVIVAAKLMGLDPSSPQMTFLLVMLHTGTMGAVLLYFWKRWSNLLKQPTLQPEGPRAGLWTRLNDDARPMGFIRAIVIATIATGVLGFGLKFLIEKIILEKVLGHPKGEVEHLFKSLPLVAMALFSAGCLILYAARRENRASRQFITSRQSIRIGLVQGLCLPFRGFSRSGATISTGLLTGMARPVAEDFSFALAVVLTPPIIVKELKRLVDATHAAGNDAMATLPALLTPGLLGMVFSFCAGLLALRWLSAWLEKGRWAYFGYYCLAASGGVLWLSF